MIYSIAVEPTTGMCPQQVSMSYAQVWALQQGGALHVAGRTNRAKVAFAEELEAAYQAVPETLPRGADAAGASLSGDMPRSSAGEREATAALAGERA